MQISVNSHLGGGQGRRLEGAREGLTIGLGTTGRTTNSPGVTPLGAVGEPLVGKGMVQGSRLGGSVEVAMGRWEGRQEKGPPSWSSRRPWELVLCPKHKCVESSSATFLGICCMTLGYTVTCMSSLDAKNKPRK